MNPFSVHLPQVSRIPILLSVPHCGTAFPAEVRNDYKADLIRQPDDTDWFVDQLYDFAPSIGITMIAAVYSRWVIDLNRDPENKPLYSDGRIITGLCPVTNFLGEHLYVDNREEVAAHEVERRLDSYYWPYHQKIVDLLHSLKAEFGKVLLWDCHSIRQYVKTVYDKKFPDLILGDSDGISASHGLTRVALDTMKSSTYSVNYNFPFKGGYITRHYGKPLEKQHTLQLEMSKVNYMDDTETYYADARAGQMRALLNSTLLAVASTLIKMDEP
jgi:N-formylglutamate deformylase